MNSTMNWNYSIPEFELKDFHKAEFQLKYFEYAELELELKEN